MRRVADRLGHYSLDGTPLRVALLRGGIARDDTWARRCDVPLIAVSTVDQVGSRLLFRGYGVTDRMKAVHAGLVGCDAMYLLDEVHLSQPFCETLQAIRGRYRTRAKRDLCTPFAVVEMSATPGRDSESVFRLDAADRAHTVLSKRLRASKPAMLRGVTARRFQDEVERQIAPMLDRPGATTAVVVNRVKTARELHERLTSRFGDAVRVELLTGRMRPFDRDAREKDLLPLIRAGRTRTSDDRQTVVVSTQTIEAGADFDFDGLVTECASLDALRQRFGRLDRLGELAGEARAAIVARSDTFKDDPVYGDAIGATWAWLESRAVDGAVDFCAETLAVPAAAECESLLAPKAHSPVLLPCHLDAFVQTNPLPEPDPDVSLWLHGPDRGAPDVQIAWRADLNETLLRQALDGSDEAQAAGNSQLTW